MKGLVGRAAARNVEELVCTAGSAFCVAEGGDRSGVQVGATLSGTSAAKPDGRSTWRSYTSPSARRSTGYLPRVLSIWWKSGCVGTGAGGGFAGEPGARGWL